MNQGSTKLKPTIAFMGKLEEFKPVDLVKGKPPAGVVVVSIFLSHYPYITLIQPLDP